MIVKNIASPAQQSFGQVTGYEVNRGWWEGPHSTQHFIPLGKGGCSNGITNSSRITLPLLLRNKLQTCAR